MTNITSRCRSLTFAIVLLSSAVPVSAQQAAPAAPGDPRWAPWWGCWQLVTETVQDPETIADAAVALGQTRANAGALVCVTPAANTGATMTTLVNDLPVLTETVVADGSRQTLTEPDCQGWHRAEWSNLGARLFAEAEITCANQPARSVSGLTMMMAGPSWLDVQVIANEGRKSLRVRRYRRAASQKHAGIPLSGPRQASAMPLGLRLSIPDVIEANGKVVPEALQAALVEVKRGFDLNRKRLLELDEAGVPDSIVDLMVALSFPKRFVVERNTSGGGGYWGTSGFDSMWPYYSDPFFYTSYYAPFGYRYWGYYDPFYFQGPGFVVVDPNATPTQASGDGRVVDGRGYTRVRRSEPEGVNGRANGGETSSAGSDSGSSGSSSGGVSSSGYSGGGGGGERTAQPRPPGGN